MQDVSPESPEERRKRLALSRAKFGRRFAKIRPGSRFFEILKRVAVGVYTDGFIHAGNLAYLALMTLFPFVIVAAAVCRLFGATQGGLQTVNALLQTMPRDVAEVLRKPIADVLLARSGNLLWLGALIGLWTTASFIETIRDIIRRAYGVGSNRPFWENRLGSIGLIVASVIALLVAFSASVLLSSVQEFVLHIWPGAQDVLHLLTLIRIVPGLILFGSLYLLFLSLTPRRYASIKCRKWPGPALVAIWWLATSALLPVVISNLTRYDRTYGSLAGVIVSLIFFFIVGLGFVIGAELNAALAATPEPTKREIEQAERTLEEQKA